MEDGGTNSDGEQLYDIYQAGELKVEGAVDFTPEGLTLYYTEGDDTVEYE